MSQRYFILIFARQDNIQLHVHVQLTVQVGDLWSARHCEDLVHSLLRGDHDTPVGVTHRHTREDAGINDKLGKWLSHGAAATSASTYQIVCSHNLCVRINDYAHLARAHPVIGVHISQPVVVDYIRGRTKFS